MSSQFMDDDGLVKQRTVTTLTGSNIRQPQDIQSHLQTTIQTHNAVSVPTGTWNQSSSWIDTDGFDKVAISILSDLTVAGSALVLWSNDGSTRHVSESLSLVPNNNAFTTTGAITDTKARYMQVSVKNTDTVNRTFTVFAYLKA
jgi:hypothetical protein